MLVLSRKVGETIVIGGQVTVTVRSVRSKYVSLGITAPTMSALTAAKSTCARTWKGLREAKERVRNAVKSVPSSSDRHSAIGFRCAGIWRPRHRVLSRLPRLRGESTPSGPGIGRVSHCEGICRHRMPS